MKKILFLFIFFQHFAFAQTINNDSTSDLENKNLFLFCKLWGFLKYYHPNVAKGNFDWEQEFINKIDSFKKSDKKETTSKLINDWLNELGTFKSSIKKENNKSVFFDKNLDLSWINNTNNLDSEVIEKLNFIKNNRFQGNSYYVELGKNGNIIEKNTPKLNLNQYPTLNERLLCLSQFWNTIEYFYPYKYLTDEKWDFVLIEMIEKFKSVQNENEFDLAILELINKTNDGHAVYKSNNTISYFGTYFFPAEIKIIEEKAIISGLPNETIALNNDLKIGDIITTLNNESVSEIIKRKYKYLNGSNESGKLRDTYYFLANGNSKNVSVKINRNDTLLEKTISRHDYDSIYKFDKEPAKFKIIENNIGYIDMAFLEMKDVEETMNKLNNTKGLIIDLRNYPKFIPYNLSKKLIQENSNCIEIIEPDLDFPGRFIYNKKITINPDKKFYDKPVIILVNEKTQSRAEFSAMLLQAGKNVITLGSQTAGADGNVSKISISRNRNMLISGTGIFYPDGNSTQRKGIKINIEVKQSIDGIKNKIDEQLVKAIEILNKN